MRDPWFELAHERVEERNHQIEVALIEPSRVSDRFRLIRLAVVLIAAGILIALWLLA